MDIVKVPKKLRDICDEIRHGNITEGISSLNKFDKLENQKNAILAEVSYFSYDFIQAIEYDKKVFPFWGQWYSSNIFEEHLASFTYATIQSNVSNDTISFYNNFIDNKLNEEDSKPHIQNYFKFQIAKQVEILTAGIDKYEIENAYKQKDNYKSMSEFFSQLKEYRPKLKADSIEAADYMLNFIYTDGLAKDFIELYEKFLQNYNFYSCHHINAAKVYLSLDEHEQAKQAIRNYVQFGWHPIEYTQVMPLTLFSEYSLYRYFTKEFLQELMYIPKVM